MARSPTHEALAIRLETLVRSYVPVQGDIRVVVGVGVGTQHCFLTFPRHGSADELRVNEDTLFEIGSTTMAFTACLMAEMVANKHVQFDDPVTKFLPARVRMPSHRGQEITLLDLANQTSGLPRLPLNFLGTVTDPANPCRDYTVDHLYAFLSSYQLRRPVGWRREHSNLGMGLLGHALSLASGQEYQQALADHVCKPLGLRDTTVSLNAEQSARFVAGYSAAGQSVRPWDMPALVGAGGLRSTARELLTFLQHCLAKRGPLQEALTMCLTPTRKSGRSAPGVLRYGLGTGLALLVLAALWQLSLVPGKGWFFFLSLLPPLAAALYGGFGPGLAAALILNAGARLIYGEGFNLPLHGLAGMVLA
ncbi:MAG TPA: serine hydrolase domain-containing protein, partial [Gemmataceae bacterium]|nr:serine hydrolase domain-containing protein [Gemmataceae bacterium]